MKPHSTGTARRLIALAALAGMLAACAAQNEKDSGTDTTMETESTGLAGCVSPYNSETGDYTLRVNAADPARPISDTLFGIFFEDINFAADGGLYAEMVQNRSFEFTRLAQGGEFHAWETLGGLTCFVADGSSSDDGLNRNNPHYLVMENVSDEPAGVANRGFLDGMAVTEGASYRFSVYLKGLDGFTGPLCVDLTAGGESVAHGEIPSVGDTWQKYTLTLTSSATASRNVRLCLTMGRGKAAADMISLFPCDTYKGRENGLRRDLAQKLEALHPAFLRFPGGCVVEGASLAWAYDWKASIGVDENREPLLFNGTYGDVAARRQGQNIWTNEHASNDPYPSYMTYGLGFYEYFLLAEDLGALPVPVVNCGLCCMGQSDGSGPDVGTPEFRRYLDDALDLVEFCRGDASTVWGGVRIAMGHEEPFPLRYLGIGNEQWGESFFRHYEAFVDAFEQAARANPELYGGIELIFTSGVSDGSHGGQYPAAYAAAASWLKAHPGKTVSDYAGAIDHHYYNEPSWFLQNVNYYDEENYSRGELASTRWNGAFPVFLGEYAAKSNTLRAALAEAAYMTGLERNGDIVVMAAYAPLFGNLTATHWAPDLIWFNNRTSAASVNYYVQQLFSRNAGKALLASELTGAELPDREFRGMAGVGTWNTAACFDNLRVVRSDTGEVLGEQTFEEDTLSSWQFPAGGRWSVENGRLYQKSTSTDTVRHASTGTSAYFGDTSWTDYTLTLEATKTAGAEGFLIPFSVQDADNHYFWNIGGWNNTVSCLQSVSDGVKSEQIAQTVKPCSIRTGQTYRIKIVVTADNVKCYLDDELYIDYSPGKTTDAEAYQVVSTGENGDIIIKLVNVTDSEKTFSVDLRDAGPVSPTAVIEQLSGGSLRDENVLGRAETVSPRTFTADGFSDRFNFTVPRYSVTVLRLRPEAK